MEDLLRIIESNTDNFIAPPYDHPDHLSLIESMLATPVGGHGRTGPESSLPSATTNIPTR